MTSTAKQTDTPGTAVTPAPESALVTTEGRTTIADTVVEKIAGMAAREVRGVHNLGRGTARALGAVRDRIGVKAAVGQGVNVEVGERQAAIDLDLVVEYGVELAELTKAVRRNVITNVERMTALEVTEVNIAINDVFIPGDDPEDEDPRVQ
ncbi:Asp23/Gls24 family envelope stress response protein [Jatrophihabitans fulvus]